MGLLYLLHILDRHENSDTQPAVLSVAVLLTVDLPVHCCNSQTVSTYGVSKPVTVSAVTAVTVLQFIYVCFTVSRKFIFCVF
jgi:hypothetical protein